MYHTDLKAYLNMPTLRFLHLLGVLLIPLLAFAQLGQPATHLDQINFKVGLAQVPNSPDDCQNCLEAEVPLYFFFDAGSGTYDPQHFKACDLVIKGHIQGEYASLAGDCFDNRFFAKKAPCGINDIVAHSFEIDPTDDSRFIIRQTAPTQELFYEESTQEIPFGTILVRALPNTSAAPNATSFEVIIDEVTFDFDCGGVDESLPASQRLSGTENQPPVSLSCGSTSSDPEFYLTETAFDPATNRFDGEIQVTNNINASQTLASFKVSSAIDRPKIDDISIGATIASSVDITKVGDDWFLTLYFTDNITLLSPLASVEVTFPPGTPPNSVAFDFEGVNAVQIANSGPCCVVDIETSTHPVGTIPPCGNQAGTGIEYGWATFNAQATPACDNIDIQLGWDVPPTISTTMQWLGAPLGGIKVIVEGENIGLPTAQINTNSGCPYNNSLINVGPPTTSSTTGLTSYEISFSFANSVCSSVSGGPFLDIIVPREDDALVGYVESVRYTSSVANISPAGSSGGGNCPHIATGIDNRQDFTGDFTGSVVLACNPAQVVEGVLMCFTENCPSTPLPACVSGPNYTTLCEATALTDANGSFATPSTFIGAPHSSTPVCGPDGVAAGVTTFDLFQIGQHILGITEFDNWWQLEAADASCNGAISAFDMTKIRRVILGLDQDFITCDSWKFYDSNPATPITNPPSPPPAAPTNSCLVSDCSTEDNPVKFYAVKTGDVNCTINLITSPADVDTEFTAGSNESTLDVSISNGPTEAIVAYEFELEVSEPILEVRGPNNLALDTSTYTLTQAGIRIAYVAGIDNVAVATSSEGEADLFTLVFAGKTQSVTSTVASDVLAVCYTAKGIAFSLSDEDDDNLGRSQGDLFSSNSSVNSLIPTIKAVPNPSHAGSNLVLNIEAAPTARSIQIIDATGRTLLQESIRSVDNGSAKVFVETMSLMPGLYTMVLLDGNGNLLASEACLIQ